MPVYTWSGRSRTNELVRGEMDAQAEKDVFNRLRTQGIVDARVRRKAASIEIRIGSGVKQKSLAIFTRQLATMIDSGMALVQSLEILGKEEPNKYFGSIIIDVKHNVESGKSFSESLRKWNKVFDSLFVNLIQAGETAGVLDTILARLAEYIEKSEALKRKVKGAMIYPVSILFVSGLVMAVMLLKVIPAFQEMFETMGNAELPKPTQIVIAISEWAQSYFLVIVGGAIAFSFAFKSYHATYRGARVIDKLLFKMPIIGTLIKKVAVAKFTRNFGTMIASGVPILDALSIVAQTAGNTHVEDAIIYTKAKITEGKTLVEPLSETKVFPQMVVQMIGVGETTGRMDQMLQKIADFYEEEVDTAVDGLTAMIEPIMLVFLGGMLGGMILAMYLPVFEMAKNF